MTPSRLSVTAIHLHPVKSCHRVEVERAVVGPYGLEGDREWQVQGPQGQMMNQRTFPALARVRPIPLPGGLRLEHDDARALEVARPAAIDGSGKTAFGPVPVADAGDDAAAWFEQVLGLPCRLVAISEGYHRRIVIGEDLFGQEVSLADAAPVHVVSAPSHRFLLEHAAEPFGIERFRPNLVVDGGAPWDEDSWKVVSVGDAEVEVVLPWPRCAIPQVDQETGRRCRERAVVLKRYRWCSQAPATAEPLRPIIEGKALFGVGGSLTPAGAEIRVGDDVTISVRREPLALVPDSRI